jgi:dUTP pyrophosphatase
MKVQIKKLHEDSKIPTYATDGSGAFDIYASVSGTLTNKVPLVFGTGVSFKIPEGHTLLIFSRSGHGFNCGVRLANCTGVIDSDYTGELMIKLFMDKSGSPDNSMFIGKGDRIAQGLVVATPKVVFEEVDKLPVTQRGSGGLGSTGV